MTNCEKFHDVIGELLDGINKHTDRMCNLTSKEANDMMALACTLKETCASYKAYAKGKLYEHGMHPDGVLHEVTKKA